MSKACDAPADTWRVMDRHQRTFGFVEGETYEDARAAVEGRPDLWPVAERGFYLRRLRESEVAAREQWAEAWHPGNARSGPWSSYSFLLADGSYVLVTPEWQCRGWKWAWYAADQFTGREAVKLSADDFRSAQAAMADAGEAVRLALYQQAQCRYVARWAEHKAPGGWGAASSWVPMPFEKAEATLVAELRRNLDKWAGRGGSDPARYRDALAKLEAATEPVTLDLPGHVLSITEAEASER